MASDLFAHELEEHRNEFLQSKHEDGDGYFFAVIERAKEVAMLLIDGEDHVHANENARALLKVF